MKILHKLVVCTFILSFHTESVLRGAQTPIEKEFMYENNDDDMPCALRSFDLDDTTELMVPPSTQPASTLQVYARHVGLALLMHYIAVKDFFFDTWSTVKNNEYVQKLVGYVYARRTT